MNLKQVALDYLVNQPNKPSSNNPISHDSDLNQKQRQALVPEELFQPHPRKSLLAR